MSMNYNFDFWTSYYVYNFHSGEQFSFLSFSFCRRNIHNILKPWVLHVYSPLHRFPEAYFISLASLLFILLIKLWMIFVGGLSMYPFSPVWQAQHHQSLWLLTPIGRSIKQSREVRAERTAFSAHQLSHFLSPAVAYAYTHTHIHCPQMSRKHAHTTETPHTLITGFVWLLRSERSVG